MRQIPTVGEKLLDRYALEELISSNEETAVFRCIDTRLNVAGAVKVLLVESPQADIDEDRISMFLVASRNQAKLNHPNIVHLTNVVSKQGVTFSAMEWLCGLTLEQHISDASENLTPKEIVELFISVIDAVNVAHASDVIHKQINPSNIFLNQQGTRLSPIVLNFGYHKFTENLDPLIQLPFLSPEQYEDFHNATEQSDVFSICATMFYAFAHNPHVIFKGVEQYESFYKRDDAEIYFPPEIPEAFVPMLKKGLSFKPEDRYASAKELLAALKEIGSNYSISANLTIEAPKSYTSGQYKPVSLAPVNMKRPTLIEGVSLASVSAVVNTSVETHKTVPSKAVPIVLQPATIPPILENQYRLIKPIFRSTEQSVLRVAPVASVGDQTYILKVINHPTAYQTHAFMKAAENTTTLSMITPRVQAPIAYHPEACAILTEDVERQSLSELIAQNGPIDPYYTLEVAIFIAQAMVCVHEARMLNGNLKPSNVIFETRDEVSSPVLYDVGQRLYVDNFKQISFEQVPFVAPELGYNLQHVNRQSDIFAFGMILNTMLYGRSPYTSNNAISLAQEIASRGNAPSLSTLMPSIDADFVRIIDWCTAYEPSDRYQSFSDVLRDLYIVHPKLEAAAMANMPQE